MECYVTFMLVYAYSNAIFRGGKRRSMQWTPADERKVTSACVNIVYRANLSCRYFHDPSLRRGRP